MFLQKLFGKLRRRSKQEEDRPAGPEELGRWESDTTEEQAGAPLATQAPPETEPVTPQQRLLNGLQRAHQQMEEVFERLSRLDAAAKALSESARVQSELPERVAEAIRQIQPTAIQEEMNGKLETIRGQSERQSELLQQIQDRAASSDEALTRVARAVESTDQSSRACQQVMVEVRQNIASGNRSLVEAISQQGKSHRRRLAWVIFMLGALIAAIFIHAYLVRP
jgi:lysyl-tRNA synthetase class I